VFETLIFVATKTATLFLNGTLIWAKSRKAMNWALVALSMVCALRIYQANDVETGYNYFPIIHMLPISAVLVLGLCIFTTEKSIPRRYGESLLILCIIAPAIYWVLMSGDIWKQHLVRMISDGILVLTTFLVVYLPGKHTKKTVTLLLALIFLLPIALFIIVQDDLSNDAMGVVMVLGAMFFPAIYYIVLFVLSLLTRKFGQEPHRVILALFAFFAISLLGANPIDAFTMWLPDELLY